MYLVFLTNSRSYFKKDEDVDKFGKFAVYWLISRGLDYTISGPLKLGSKQQTFQILSTSSAIEFGNICLRMLKFFTLSLARRTCMRTDAISLVSSSSSGFSWSLLLMKGGILS